MKEHPAATPEGAARVLHHHFGKKPKDIKRIHGGLANHVFEARLGKDELILRISEKPDKLQVFMKEQWAVTAARKIKIPTPEILEVSNDVLGLPYMISRKVEGRPATSVGRERMAVLKELGEYAVRINGIKTHDFGHIFDWSPNRLSRNRTWPQYLDNELKVQERMEIFARTRILNSGSLKKLRQAIRSMRRWTGNPTLSHGDIRLKNALVNEDRKVVCILDWENCTSQLMPHWELSIALHDLSMDEKEVFLAGYGLGLKEYMQMAPAIKALNVLNYAFVVQRSLDRKDKAKLLSLRARLNGTFDLYSL